MNHQTESAPRPLRLWWLAALLCAASAAHAQQVIQSYLPNQWPDSRYEVHDNGTVTDTVTGLMWKRCTEGLSGADCSTGSAEEMNWKDALLRAQGSTFANYFDWRLPNIKELASLAALDRYNPAINLTVFPNTPADFPNTPADWFWSSSPNAEVSGNAWSISFNYGNDSYDGRGNNNRVRLVRGGQ